MDKLSNLDIIMNQIKEITERDRERQREAEAERERIINYYQKAK
jgi:hypothetical protein